MCYSVVKNKKGGTKKERRERRKIKEKREKKKRCKNEHYDRRCVELDVHDGEDGQPIITHGGTATTKIKVCDTLPAIREYSFKKSPFPVILSIENHLSEAQEEVLFYFILFYFIYLFWEG